MEKKRYVAPFVREVTSLDMESQILGTSNDQKTLVTVDPVDEVYYGGETSGTSDYLIKF